MTGVSLRIFLADGIPEGLRVVEKINWTGRALMCSKTQYPEVRGREEFGRPSIYLLSGPSERETGGARIYIGEADVGRNRIDNHVRGKDFWTHLILFTSKDENLNKAHVKYIESRLVALAQQAKRSELDNGNVPQAPSLSEADTADAESFLADMLLIYPLLGIDAFEVVQRKPRRGARLFLEGKSAKAEGRDTPEGFVVAAGSIARRDTVPSIQDYMVDLRRQLLAGRVLVEAGEGLTLTQDYAFNSPSTAAGVMLGRSANGRIEWRDERGRTLKDIQEAAIGSASEDES